MGFFQGGRSSAGLLLLALTAAALPLACGSDSPAKKVMEGQGGGGGEAGATVGAGGEPVAPSAGAGAGMGGDATGGAGTAEDSISFAQYCAGVAERYFDWLALCYGKEHYSDAEREGFVERSKSRCLEAAPSVADGRIGFEGPSAAECLDSLDAREPANACDGFDFLAGVGPCNAIFTPLVEPGGDCYPESTLHFSVTLESECHEGFCEAEQGVCPGSCTPYRDDDEACDSSAECAPDSYCSQGACAPRHDQDEACEPPDGCLAGLSCVVVGSAEQGTCRPPSAAGDACTAEEPCTSGYDCIEEQCASKVPTDAPCSSASNCFDAERCLDRDGNGRTCGPPGALDVPCESQLDCAPELYCDLVDTGACVSKVELLGACSDDFQCSAGTWCNTETGQCQASGAEGAACTVNGFPAASPAACSPELLCMSDGKCHPVGDIDEPCHVTDSRSCVQGTFCSRDGFTCQPLGKEDDFCNPFATPSCEGDLACLCSDASCGTFQPTTEPDTVYKCAPRREPGETCFDTSECVMGTDCLGEQELTCTLPTYTPCLPE